MWINKINGKKYIGLHKGTEDDGYTGSGTVFNRAVKKYGIENFERKILYREFTSKQNLYQKEFDIINELNAVFSLDYYNQSNYDPKFVKFVEGKKERIVSEETRAKMSNIAKKRIGSEETTAKMSKNRKGRPSPTKGKTGLTSGIKDGQFGKKWYNNGIQDWSYIPGEEPDGWVLGRIGGANKGIKNGFYGKSHTEESKEKFRETLRKKKEKDENNSQNPN